MIKPRQIKKNSNTAKTLLMRISATDYPEKIFIKSEEECHACPKGTWEIWSRTSYEYDEWDAQTAFDVLRDLVYWRFAKEVWDEEENRLELIYKPDTRTAKKVFDLAKNVIQGGAI